MLKNLFSKYIQIPSTLLSLARRTTLPPRGYNRGGQLAVMSEAATLTTEITAAPTPLARQLQTKTARLDLSTYAGALTHQNFSSIRNELAAAITGAACFDLGYRTRIRVTGEDGLRWLNGMVSNAIQTLPEGEGNYSFVLNAQGRIQGDCYIYRRSGDLLLDTDRSQAQRLLTHLDHFIIMDDVELHPLDDSSTGIGLTGPQAACALDTLGLPNTNFAPMHLMEAELAGAPATLVHGFGELRPRFELWFAPQHALSIWNALTSAGATPIGIDAVEVLRVLEGTPRFGVDITDRHLPQETAQTRALNFTKGCYLGQEIVERIRSRATVHRALRQFQLDGVTPPLPVDLHATDNPSATIGQLTSVAEVDVPGYHGTLAIGSIRTEALERKATIVYQGGTVQALDRPPLPPDHG
jgi:folate-binding protein YgfZ